jgi:uncharacterized iron-regulated membrane protein
MLDLIAWTAIFVALFFGIVLICIDLLEEWEYPSCAMEELPHESPTVRLKHLAKQLEKRQPRRSHVA